MNLGLLGGSTHTLVEANSTRGIHFHDHPAYNQYSPATPGLHCTVFGILLVPFSVCDDYLVHTLPT